MEPRQPQIRPLQIDPQEEGRAWQAVIDRRNRRRSATHALVVVLAVALAASPVLVREGSVPQGRVVASQGEEMAPPTEVTEEPDVAGNSSDPNDASFGAGSSAQAGRSSADSQGPPERPGATGPADRAAPRPAKQPVTRERSSDTGVLLGCVSEWCVSARAQEVDGVVTVGVDLCVPTGSRTRRFSFPTTQEVDFQIRPYPDGKTVWIWSKGQAFAAADHNVDIAPGECVRWTTDWDGRADDGTTVEAGTFDLTVQVLCEQSSSPRNANMTFQYGGSE